MNRTDSESAARSDLLNRLREVLTQPLPLPGSGQTALRHRMLMAVGRENLSLARLAEAHWDAVAILAEAGRCAVPGAIYGVWASEIPGKPLALVEHRGQYAVQGVKLFCSGAGIVDRALLTVGAPDPLLIDVDLHRAGEVVSFDDSAWKTTAFAETRTAQASFEAAPVTAADIVENAGWYLRRPGFWLGACGPASCWAGGAAGLVDWAEGQRRRDPHTLAHLGAMRAAVWEMEACLESAGRQIDSAPADIPAAHARALTLRHLIEQAGSDVLRRITRAYGPHPLAFDGRVSRRHQELDLYLRQSHAERDLEALGALGPLAAPDTPGG